MATKTDRRPERTRAALLSAFIDLILERGYEAVTVADVIDRANIGRSTLYAHFGSLEGMLKVSMTRPSGPLAALISEPVVSGGLVGQLEHFREQRQRNKAFFVPPIRGVWVRTLAEMIEPRLAALPSFSGAVAPALPLGFIALQVAEQQIALVVNWLALRPMTSAAVMAEALAAVTRATVEGFSPKPC